MSPSKLRERAWTLTPVDTGAGPQLTRESTGARRALPWQRMVAAAAQRVFVILQSAASHKAAICVVVALLPMAARLAMLRFAPMPVPAIHDEYSYLLAADTFRAGHLTNPTHPMWKHFETFHELMHPTYQSKYQPAQGLMLALGWKLFGHPWYGSWLSFGIMCACLCWMMQGWLPPVYALLGMFVAIGQIGIFSYWMDSYWGGAIPAAAGALVLGAVPRLARKASVTAAVAAAVGAIVLANSRPYEGFVVVAGAAVALWWWRRKLARPLRGLLVWRTAMPFALICACGGAWTGYYNYRVTGDPLKMPYVAYNQDYMVTPNWLIAPAVAHPPTFRYREIANLWLIWEKSEWTSERHNPLRALAKLAHDGLAFYFSLLIGFAVVAVVLLSRSRKVMTAAAVWCVLAFAVVIETWHYPHYLAPGTGLLFVLVMYGARMLRVGGGRMGAALVLIFSLVPLARTFGSGVAAYQNANAPHPRRDMIKRFLARGGKHLMIVRYAPDHSIHDDEWVFNAANIDASPIVWARDMGEQGNRELIDYYPDRQVWLVYADRHTAEPYPGAR